jgi:hypothetical protein
MAVFFLLLEDTVAQNIHTVSINPKIPAQFDDLQTAINAATAGDVIYVHPATDNYDGEDSLVIDKAITIIGGGYYNDKNTYAGEITKFNRIRIKPVAGKIKIANLAAGRIILEGVEGNTFENLSIEYVYADRIDIEAANGTFSSNKLHIINSILPLVFFENWNQIDATAKINIENNIIGQIANGGGVNLFIRNNIFNPEIFGKLALANMYNATIVNNIFFGNEMENSIGVSTTDFCIYDRNLSYQTIDSFNGGTDNVIGANNFNNKNPSFTSVSGDWDTLERIVKSNFTLATGSPAIASGTEGTNIGTSGGEFPFSPQTRYGHPHVKSIKVNNPVLGTSDTLRFTIEGVYPSQN